MNVYDSAKVRYTLDRELSRGGEGMVWTVAGKPDLLAKVYLPQAQTPQAKLQWMVNNPPDDPMLAKGHTSIAWPKTILLDDRGKFTGFLMPFVRDAIPLLKVYNPRLRAKTWPGFNWQYLHRTARNLSSAVEALHAKGYVIGDINEGNVVVRKDALISVIDTDSFQVQAQSGRGKTYHCPVGKEDFTPPELQGKSFANTMRTSHHDSFGLGVIIFLLLMDGAHPFKSQWVGSGDPPGLSQKITTGLFPYQTSPNRNIQPPRGGASFDHLHPALQDIFRRCFVNGHKPPHIRPTADEWEKAIVTAEKALIECANGHFYSGHLQTCPHCSTASRGQQVPLPAVSRPSQPTPRISQPATSRAWTPTPSHGAGSSTGRRLSNKQLVAAGGGLLAAVLAGAMIFGGGGGDGGPSGREAGASVTTPTVARTATARPSPTPAATADPRMAGGCWTAAQVVPAAGQPLQWSFPPAQVISPGKSYIANIETSRGTIAVELQADEMPETVNNFVCLARSGYYDGTSFYRITATALQGGDPTGTGSGGPGYEIPDEPFAGEYTRGTIAMVNEGPDTNGSRYFLFADDYTGLKRYPIFGQVVSGVEVLDAIVANPSEATTVNTITITEQ